MERAEARFRTPCCPISSNLSHSFVSPLQSLRKASARTLWAFADIALMRLSRSMWQNIWRLDESETTLGNLLRQKRCPANEHVRLVRCLSHILQLHLMLARLTTQRVTGYTRYRLSNAEVHRKI
ncbi:hypothetical protein PV11_02472 [Exophiala sideris]|uniref:Uncharacterized protein n=1 Tax=Exophiala sideris TaxID=1016849 RepID=A0A0D1XFJ0_9EURO|nr:hypothetical protein PV11_02472 [Exophiala sideris]